jgi:RNAse (barnase) inhibitor barstar
MKREELASTLSRGDRAGVFTLPAGDVPAMVAAATGLRFAVFSVSLAGCTEADEVLARLGEGLQFPSWFGQNWDALADCLTDFSWREAPPGFMLVLEQLSEFRAAGDKDFDTLIEILSDASASWSGRGIPFWAFLVLRP